MREDLIVCLPDYQIPYHDAALVKLLAAFVGAVQPSKVIHVGDFMDEPEPSRWTKGAAGEYAGTLAESFEVGRNALADLRSRFDGPIHLKVGNHDRRVSEYIRRYAPALACFNELRLESLLTAEALGVTIEHNIFDVAPGWVCAHGDEGGLSSKAGETALKLAVSVGKSVVCGHTHRAALLPASTGYNGKTRTIYGMEVGNAMKLGTGTGYLRKGAANWQHALGVLRVRGNKVHPQVIFVEDGGFYFDGQWFGKGR